MPRTPCFLLLVWAARAAARAFARANADGHGICRGDVPQRSGYLPAGPDEDYFYYLATSRSAKPDLDPLVIWLTGGPGCSSMLAMLKENGPCRIAGHGPAGWEVAPNHWSWSEVANVVWVDQPVGVGYSTRSGKLMHDEAEVAERMFKFLQSFYVKFPHFLSVPLFLTGESYGGHYVSAVAARVVRGQNDGVGLLQGMAIGNALVDPIRQYATKPEMAFTGGAGGSLHRGVVDAHVYRQMKRDLVTCEEDIKRCQKHPQQDYCMKAMMDCAMSQTGPVQMSGMNPYDLREVCNPRLNPNNPATQLCSNNTLETDFLNDPVIKQSLGARSWRPWSTCNATVLLPFVLSGDYLMNSRQDVITVLAAGVRVLVYAGDTDAMIDYLGCRRWVEALPWAHQKEWLAAPQEPVFLGGLVKGKRQSAWGLTFLQVFDAGHMVPHDQPEFSLAMLRDFIDHPTSRVKGHAVSTNLFALPLESGAALGVALGVALGLLVPAWYRAKRRDEQAYFLMI